LNIEGGEGGGVKLKSMMLILVLEGQTTPTNYRQ
jgi:hypothetical protein